VVGGLVVGGLVVGRRQPADLGADRTVGVERGECPLERRRRHHEAGRHRDAGPGELAEARPLATCHGPVGQLDIGEVEDEVCAHVSPRATF
jgi:hypothetical protein